MADFKTFTVGFDLADRFTARYDAIFKKRLNLLGSHNRAYTSPAMDDWLCLRFVAVRLAAALTLRCMERLPKTLTYCIEMSRRLIMNISRKG